MPTLKTARTAFNLPVLNESAPSLAGAWGGEGFPADAGFSFAGLGQPRRSASVVTAASRASISPSSNRFSALARSLGNK